jgi:hypothetical protein
MDSFNPLRPLRLNHFSNRKGREEEDAKSAKG